MPEPTLTTLAEAARLLATGGPTVGLLALLWAIHTGRLVTAREHKELADERDRLRAERDAERARLDALAAAAAAALDRLADEAGRGPGH